MQEFSMWFSIGFSHIVSVDGIDHVLFLLTLLFFFPHTEWKKFLALISFFTIAHSITLALSVSDVIRLSPNITEPLIACTILISSLINLFRKQSKNFPAVYYYILVFVFGLIHGMGFSYLLKSLIGSSAEVLYPLLAFNLGLEAGQVLILGTLILISVLLRLLVTDKFKYYEKTVTMVTSVLSVYFLVSRLV